MNTNNGKTTAALKEKGSVRRFLRLTLAKRHGRGLTPPACTNLQDLTQIKCAKNSLRYPQKGKKKKKKSQDA
jgi:hypothetical protein